MNTLAQVLNDPRELHPQRLRRLWRHGIISLALEQIHAIKAKGADLDQGFCISRLRLGDMVDEERICIASTSFDI